MYLRLLLSVFFLILGTAVEAGKYKAEEFIPFQHSPFPYSGLFDAHGETAEEVMRVLAAHQACDDHFKELAAPILKTIEERQRALGEDDSRKPQLGLLQEEVRECMTSQTLTLPRSLYIGFKLTVILDPTHYFSPVKRLLQGNTLIAYSDLEKRWQEKRLDESFSPLVKQPAILQVPFIQPQGVFGVRVWNFLSMNGVLPVAAPFEQEGYLHGQPYSLSDTFFHDLVHNFSHTRKPDDFRRRRSLFKKIYKTIEAEKEGDVFRRAHMAYFLIHHEFTPPPLPESVTDAKYMESFVESLRNIMAQEFRTTFAEALAIDMNILKGIYPGKGLTYDEEAQEIQVEDIERRTPFKHQTDDEVMLERLRNYTDFVALLRGAHYSVGKEDRYLIKILRTGDQGAIAQNMIKLRALYSRIISQTNDLLEWFINRYLLSSEMPPSKRAKRKSAPQAAQ